MRKMNEGQAWKLVASTTLLCLALSTSYSQLVAAHTVLGDLDGTIPYYRKNDHESNPKNVFGLGHLPGPLAHMWPSSGSNRYLEDPTRPPGYQSPFQNYEQPFQLAGSRYSPEGAILTSTSGRDTVGDFIIGINFSQPGKFPSNNLFRYWSITIYIPAPFKNKAGFLEQDGFEPAGINWDLGETTNIVTTLTDSYGNISVTRAGSLDPFGPNWWMIRIGAGGGGMVFTAPSWEEWYYIRINQMRAPVVAGRYFFKIFLDDHYPTRAQNNELNLISSTMPAENWPVVLVKGELDPAIAFGTIRYGGSNQAFYGMPLRLPGRVRFGGVAVDPANGRILNRTVEARGYLNASSKGHYEVEGIAPGIYDVFVSAAGFPEQKHATKIMLARGQSFSLDLYLKPGTEVRGEVFAKCFGSPIDWHGQFPVSIVIYDSDDYKEASIASYSPINLTHAPFTSYVNNDTVFDIFGTNPSSYFKWGLRRWNVPRRVAFPWEGPLSYYPYTEYPDAKDPYGVFNGVGPAQTWWVSPNSTLEPVTRLGSTGRSFLFQFGAQGFYGAPARLSGMIPQIFATWIDGLQPRTYFLRAYVHGYVQTTSDGSMFKDYAFKITSIERDAALHIQMDVYKGGTIQVTVHFHDSLGTRTDAAIGGPDPARYIIAESFDYLGQTSALNFTLVPKSSSSTTILLTGLGMAGVVYPPDPRSGVKYSLLRYRGIRDYGVTPGTHTIRVYIRGYVQASAHAETLQKLDIAPLCFVALCSQSHISLHMYRGGGINATIRSVDWQIPRNARNWVWNGTEISTLVYDMASKSFVDVIYFWNSSAMTWSLPKANILHSTVPWPGWASKFGSGSSYILTNGSVILERLGPAFPNQISRSPSQDMATNLFRENMFPVTFLYSPGSYRATDFRSNVAIYPGKYSLTAWTYGYVQEGVYTLSDLGKVALSVGSLAAQADSNIELIKGTSFNITIVFRKEGIFEGIPHNSSARIRIYDSSDRLVAAASTSLDFGAANPKSESTGFFADGRKIVLAGGGVSIPKGTMVLQYRNLAGLYRYSELLTGNERLQAIKRAQLFSPDYGVWGSVLGKEYRRNWNLKIDIVNWYLGEDEFHPAPAALLHGESSFLFPYNHLGPYEPKTDMIIPNVPVGGEASVAVALDLRAYIQGHVYSINWFEEVRMESWVSVQMRKGREFQRFYSFDGFYDAYLSPGSYEFKLSITPLSKGEVAVTRSLFLSDGASILGEDFFLGAYESKQGPAAMSCLSSLGERLRRTNYVKKELSIDRRTAESCLALA